MKKRVLLLVLSLAGMAAFSEAMTNASLAASVEKFLNGNGKYLKVSVDDGFTYIPKSELESYSISHSKLMITVNKESGTIGVGADIEANDVSVDANGNLVFQKK